MSCQHCLLAVTKALEQLEGINNIQIDLTTGEVRFNNKRSVPMDLIEKVIAESGFEIIPDQLKAKEEIKSEDPGEAIF